MAEQLDTVTADSELRLWRTRYALRNDRWWEARQILAEARKCEDWQRLGHESWDRRERDASRSRWR